MMLGGLGSIRLRSKVIDGERLYYLGASSTGKSHEGVPIALREENYRDIVQLIKSSCGARANIIGTLQALPMERSTLHLNSAIPRYSILVEKAEVLGPSSPRDLLITVAVMHAPHIRGQLLKSETWAAVPRKLCKSWTFCSFTPDRKERALRKAVDWLRAYAIRFSGDPNPMIFSDFDEHYQHFADPVEFSLQGLFAGDIDITTLKHYAEMYGLVLNIETLHVGDVVRDIQNSTIINRSEVKLTEETFLGRLKRRLMGNRREHS
jgi:hypothetical protein